MRAEALLSRLTKCRASGDGKWQACCPAHEDKSPSLSIREMTDGRILVHCFAGCSWQAVMDAVGLPYAYLYPEGEYAPKKKDTFFDEVILALAASDRARGEKLSQRDRDAELNAFMRLKQCR